MSLTFPDNSVQKRGCRRTRSAPVRGIQRAPDVWDKVSYCFKLSCMQVGLFTWQNPSSTPTPLISILSFHELDEIGNVGFPM